MSLFLKALWNKWRFKTSKGNLNIEQVIEIGRATGGEQFLHDLYLSLEDGIQKSKGLLGKKGNALVEEKMEIVKAIFKAVVAEKEANQELADNKSRKAFLLEAAAAAEKNELLEGKSAKDLRKMAAKL